MNNVTLVLVVQQRDSVIPIYVSILPQILFPTRLVHNSRVPCAIQQVLVGYPYFLFLKCLTLFILYWGRAD